VSRAWWGSTACIREGLVCVRECALWAEPKRISVSSVASYTPTCVCAIQPLVLAKLTSLYTCSTNALLTH
jgi:hypothetical protein